METGKVGRWRGLGLGLGFAFIFFVTLNLWRSRLSRTQDRSRVTGGQRISGDRRTESTLFNSTPACSWSDVGCSEMNGERLAPRTHRARRS